MLRGLYNVASGMEVASRNHEIVSENLAHADTPGYRRQGLLYDAVASSANTPPPTDTPSRSVSPSNLGYFPYLESGPLQPTGNPLDLALVGNAFFVLEGPTGPVYTRNGAFELHASGRLQARNSGYRVSGNITIPPTATQISVAPDGVVSADGVNVGRLQLASFDRPDALRRAGPTLFQGDDPQTPPPGAVSIQQGFREGSNVQPVQEMISMMMGLRYYEAAEKAMRALSDAITQNTRPQT